jgi:uncharacterized membrane protein
MSNAFPRKCHADLIREIGCWQSQGIITEVQSKQLIEMYPPPATNGRLIAILMNLGAVLIGLGGLLFVAANWHSMTAGLKVFWIILSIVTTNYAGWHFRFEPGNRLKLGTAMLLLGALFYGAGIWLMSQIFNFDTSAADGLLVWSVGVLASALVTGVAPLAVLLSVLIAAWSIAASANVAGFALALAVSLFVSCRLRSPWAAAVALVGGGAWICAMSSTFIFGMVAYGTALFCAYLWHRKRWQVMAAPYLYVGVSLTFLALLFGTGDMFWSKPEFNFVSAIVLFLVSLSAGAVAASEDRDAQPEVIGAIVLSILAASLIVVDVKPVGIAISNILLLGSMACLMWSGVNRLQSIPLVNLTIGFFVVDIIARYFDMFYSMLDRSLFFVAGGIVLMAAGCAVEKGRRRIIEGIAS